MSGTRVNMEVFLPLFVSLVCCAATMLGINSCSRKVETPLTRLGGIPVSWGSVVQAAQKNDVNLLNLLRACGADLDAKDESGKTALMHAAESGSMEAAEFLACNTATLTERDEEGVSAFAYAMSNAHLPVATMLLCSGATVDEAGHHQKPLLVTAVMQENHPAMLMLLENRAGFGMNPALREALKKGSLEFAKDLLRFGADPNLRIDGKPALAHAISTNNGAAISLLLKYGADPNKKDTSGESALMLALAKADDPLAIRLLDAGGDPNLVGGDGQPPLLRLIGTDRLEMMTTLLDRGADAAYCDEKGTTLLGYGLMSGNFALAEALIEKGVNPDAPCRGEESPIEIAFTDKNLTLAEFLLKRDAAAHPVLFHRAIEADSREIIDLYLDYGADVDALDSDGDTALSKCVRNGQIEMAEHLIQRGANVLTPGKEGQEPLLIAVAVKNAEMAKMLIDQGADPNRRLVEPYSKAYRSLVDSSTLSYYMARDSHFYPIMVAAANGHGDTIRVLLENGARQYPYTKNWQRYPISFASEAHHIEAQQLLVGYDPKKATESIKVVVNLTTQRAVLYKNGEPALNSRVSTGKSGYRTPTGEYVITHKHRHWNSSLYGSSMPYFMRLSCAAFGMHVGYVPGYPASHGCIRMPESGAISFWKNAPVGTPVSIVK